jgi:hypothetical protein
MLKRLNAYLMLCIFTCSLAAHPDQQQHDSKFWQNALFGAVAVGATISFFFWWPSAAEVVQKQGIGMGMATTLVPRVALDAATIAACAIAVHEINKSEEKSRDSQA